MALSITEVCVSCHACLYVCPDQAVVLKANKLSISSARCTECAGDFSDPLCTSICPVEGALLGADGKAFHAPGALSGVIRSGESYLIAESRL